MSTGGIRSDQQLATPCARQRAVRHLQDWASRCPRMEFARSRHRHLEEPPPPRAVQERSLSVFGVTN